VRHGFHRSIFVAGITLRVFLLLNNALPVMVRMLAASSDFLSATGMIVVHVTEVIIHVLDVECCIIHGKQVNLTLLSSLIGLKLKDLFTERKIEIFFKHDK
jgi:hypothetical protein